MAPAGLVAVTYIRHVTLNTGHTRDSRPGEVTPEALAATGELLAQAFAADPDPVLLPIEGYALSARGTRHCMTAIVWADGAPICTMAVALHSRCGASVWRALHGFRPDLATDPERCPPEPWVAALLEGPIVQHVDATEWLGDLERCLAWAWWKSRHGS